MGPWATSGRALRGALAVGFALACCALAARAEPPGRLPFRSYGTREGLVNLVVLRIAQDRDGFLWLATEDGLFRYDGTHFERFGNEEGLPSSVILALAVENDRDVWVGTLTGLAQWQGTRFAVVPADRGLPQERVNEIAVARGNLWVALQSGLYRRTGAGRFEPVPGWTGGEPTALWADANGGMIVASAKGLRSCSPSGNWSTLATAAELGREPVDAAVRDARGVLWARSPNRLWSRRPGAAAMTDETGRVPRGNQKGTLSLDRRGRLLVPTIEGIAREENGRWTFLGTPEGFPVRSLHCALEDDEGSLWIGANGLHQLVGRGYWHVFGGAEGLEGDVAWTELRDSRGRLWVGTEQGLARDLGTRWQMVPALRGRAVRTVAEAADGALWLSGSPSEVVRLDPRGSITIFGAREGVSGKRIFKVLVDRRGVVWVATDGAGLLRMDPRKTKTFTRVELPGGTDDERLGGLLEDREGRLWAAGELGLAVLEGNSWRRLTAADGLRVTRTAYVIERRDGEMCVAYLESLGLSCFRTQGRGLTGLRNFDASNGLPGARVYLIGEDRQDRLWAGTGFGVAVFGPSGVDHFTEAQGLPNDDMAAMSFLAEPNGDVWIGTADGLGRFSGASYQRLGRPPRTRILSAQLGRRDFDPASAAKVEAPHADDTLSVQFTGLTFLDPFRVEHEVRLWPLESAWHATKAREARYTALATGTYSFEVRTRMPSGPWSEPARFSFEIQPAWWQRAWFLLLLAVAVALALAGLLSWAVGLREAQRDRASRARHSASFRALIMGMPDVVIVHREGRVVYANTAAATLLGWRSPEEMVGTRVLDLLEPAERSDVDARIRHVTETGEPAPPREERLVRRDGTFVTLEVSGLTLDFGGQQAVVAVARDVTERRQLQERLLLSDRMASVGTLAAGVAHEINNPLSYTIANLSLLVSEIPHLASADPERARALTELIDDARDGAERVRKIVRGLKAFSRAADEDPTSLEPSRVLDQSIDLASNEIRHRARLVRVYQEVPTLWADESRLVQVFINLLVNAAHSIPEGHVEKNEIVVSIRPRGASHVAISVRDTGAGIRPEIIGRIFDPFFTTKPVGVGTGLGLSICHGIVTRMGGEISVQSEPGKGSTFTVILPVASEQREGAPLPSPLVPAPGRRGRILVVDDDLLVAASVRRVLGGEHDVTLLPDGETALAHLEQVPPYDLVLCDLMMPRMTGMELHERLTQRGSPQVETFVFLTGGAFTAAARQFLDRVPNERVEKPFDNATLRALVRRFVSRQSGPSAASA